MKLFSEISETIRATILGLVMQIPEIPAKRKFVSAGCNAHSHVGQCFFTFFISRLTSFFRSRPIS